MKLATSTRLSLEDKGDFRSVLARLHAAGVLRSDQVDLLLTRWQSLDDDDFAHPILRNLGEHTRAILAHLASHFEALG